MAKEIEDIKENRQLEVLPIRNMVFFPGVLMPVAVSRKTSLKLIKSANKDGREIMVLTQKDNAVAEPTGRDLYALGTIARVRQIVPIPEMGEGEHVMAILEGLSRAQAIDFQEDGKGQLTAEVQELEEAMPLKRDKQFAAVHASIRDLVLRILNEKENPPVELLMTLKTITNGPTLINYVCATYDLSVEKKQELLAIDVFMDRATALLTILEKDNEMLSIKADIRKRTHEAMDKQQREYFLQQEIETIKQDLGDTDQHGRIIGQLGNFRIGVSPFCKGPFLRSGQPDLLDACDHGIAHLCLVRTSLHDLTGDLHLRIS